MAQRIQIDIVAADKFSATASKVKKATEGIRRSTAKLSSGMERVTRRFTRFGNAAKRFGKGFSLRVGAPIAVAGGLAVKSFATMEESLANVKQGLDNVVGGTKLTVAGIKEIAKNIQRTTKVSDIQALSIENTLLNFKNVGQFSQKQLAIATKAVINFAQVSGRGLITAATNLGIAFADPVKQIGFMTSRGFTLDKSVQSLIKRLVEMKRPLDALKVGTNALGKSFVGAAEAAGTTFAGKLIVLKNTFNASLRPFGKIIAEILTPFLDSFTKFLRNLEKTKPEMARLVAAIGGIAVLLGPVILGLGGFSVQFAVLAAVVTRAEIAMIAFSAVPVVVAILVIIAALVLLVQHWDEIKPAVMNVVNLFRKGGQFSGVMGEFIFQLKQAVRLIDILVDGLKFLFRTAKSVGGGLGDIFPVIGGKSPQQLLKEMELRRSGGATPTVGFKGISAIGLGAGVISGGGLLGTIQLNIVDRGKNVQSVSTRATSKVQFDTGHNQPGI